LDNGGRRAPGAATALRVDLTSPGLYPRVRVLASCGDKELDALAAKQVCQEVLKLGPDWQDAAAVGPNVRALWRD